MGVIKDGTISGVLPKKVGFAVHYPGYPSSTFRAIETLGGTDGIMKARNSESAMELHFRPEDPYSHPAFGWPSHCSNLLLKISRKKTSGDQEAVVSESVFEHSSTKTTNHSEIVESGLQKSIPENDLKAGNKGDEPQMKEAAVPLLSADIVARVSEAYHFKGMVDYQHLLAVHANAAQKRKRHWTEMEPNFENGGLMDIDQEDMMILVPPLFSMKDVPRHLVLKPSSLLSAKKKQEIVVKDCWEMQIEPCLGIEFDIEKIPHKINWGNHIPRDSKEWEQQMDVSKLFDERPIWHKLSLIHRLLDEGIEHGIHKLRRLLFRTGYYFSTGPFRQLWIRKGYDPRKDPESRIYQNVDFRVRPPLRNSGDVDADVSKRFWRDLCAFRVFPCKRQTSFQLFDLVDDYIQEEIRKPSEQTTCSCSTGWFSSHVCASLRYRMQMRFLSVYPETGAEKLLKYYSKRFEKSKRAHESKRDVRPEELEHHHVNKDSNNYASKTPTVALKGTELVCNDGKDESDDNDDEIEEDEDEEEEEEEELDDLETFQVDGDDADFTLSSHRDREENFSKNYLQDLFGNFPGSSKAQDAGASDGEYNILDDYYSDEDDNDDY